MREKKIHRHILKKKDHTRPDSSSSKQTIGDGQQIFIPRGKRLSALHAPSTNFDPQDDDYSQQSRACCRWAVEEAGAELDVANVNGCSVAHWAASGGDLQVCR